MPAKSFYNSNICLVKNVKDTCYNDLSSQVPRLSSQSSAFKLFTAWSALQKISRFESTEKKSKPS